MNTEIIDAGRDISGGYKVDVSRGENVDRVSSEWFSRPDDERYLSLDDLFASVKDRAERSRTRTVESAAIRVEAHRDKGAMDGPAFAAYIREVLVREIAPGTVVILDNLATHRNKEAAQALRDHGCWFLYLPPYSPDLKPIELAYSKLKAHLRRIGARTFTEVFEAIGSICDLYEPTECSNYFKAAGYVSG